MRRSKIIWVGIAAALILAASWLVSDGLLKKKGYEGTGDLLYKVWENYPKSLSAEPLELAISVDEESFAHLERVVENARAEGVILPDGNHYVNARIASEGNDFKAKIRIKGKLTDHVKGDKWSLRIIGLKGGKFQQMRRFSIQHPGTRNYAHEWLYHRIMEREDVIALRYGFVDVSLNSRSLGVYAYEEHFGQELLSNNKRIPGPIFRFDPSLYWIHRLNEMNDIRFNEAFASHQAAMLDTYDSKDVFKSEERTAQFRQALLLMNGLRSGMLSASEVFDTDRVAKRHAIIDLIGGHHSMDWSDIKFYYNPDKKHIEPVSYESFSVQPLKQLAGAYRYTGKERSRREIHDVFFSNEQLFRHYISHLERVSSQSYLDSLFNDLRHELDSVSAILFKEFPYKTLNEDLYYKNAEVIRSMLDMPQGAHGFATVSNDSLQFQFVPVGDLPIEVYKVVSEDGVEVLDQPVIVPCRKQGRLGRPVNVSVALNNGPVNTRKLKFEWSILGATRRKISAMVPMEFPDESELKAFVNARRTEYGVDQTSSAMAPQLVIDTVNKQYLLNCSSCVITQDIIVPKAYELRIHSASKVIFDGVNLIVDGGVNIGNSWIEFTNGGRMVFQGQSGSKTLLSNSKVVFSGSQANPCFVVRDRRISIKHVSLDSDSSQNAMMLVNADCNFDKVSIAGGKDLLKAYHSHIGGTLNLKNAFDDGLQVYGGGTKKQGIIVVAENINDCAVSIKAGANMELSSLFVSNSAQGLLVNQGSSFTADSGTFIKCATGIKAKGTGLESQPTKVQIEKANFDEVETRFKSTKGAILIINGSEPSTKDNQ